MVSPHWVVILSEATAGRNSVTKAPRRLASTRTTAEARGKMLAGSSRQYQGAGQCDDKIDDSGENWFPEVSIETPEFKQVFGRQNPHRRTAAHLSAQALPHSMFRAVLIAFHVLLGIAPSGVAAVRCLLSAAVRRLTAVDSTNKIPVSYTHLTLPTTPYV